MTRRNDTPGLNPYRAGQKAHKGIQAHIAYNFQVFDAGQNPYSKPGPDPTCATYCHTICCTGVE